MIELLRMNESHVSQVAQLEKICFVDPWSENSVASELKNPLSLWLVAMDGQQLAGYIGSQSVGEEADMMNVAVHPDFRKNGIGRMLIMQLIETLKTKGIHCLTLEVRASNVPAIDLYEKLDFKRIGCRPNYYRHPREDALIMRKEWQK